MKQYSFYGNFSCLFVLAMSGLTACGGSSDSSDPGDILETETIETFQVFEGKTSIVDSGLDADDLTWQQLSGPEVDIDDSQTSQLTVTAPWINSESEIAEFEVSGSIDGESYSKRINLKILDRGFLVMKVQDDSATNLYLNYISTNDEVGVPDLNTIQLTDVAANTVVCGHRISPSGQYIAYLTAQPAGSIIFKCRGVQLVDIETLEQQTITPSGVGDVDIEIREFSWSADSLKISYIGDHGEGYEQAYVTDIETGSTSYINYGINLVESNFWPSGDLFPVDDGGNPYNLELIDNYEVSRLNWLGNSNGLSFVVYDFELGDFIPYQASVHGDTQKLERLTLVAADIWTLDEEDEFNQGLDGCTSENPCATMPDLTIDLTPIQRSFVNPELMETSVDGHLSMISTMISTNSSPIKVLSVRRPVIDESVIRQGTPIEATQVYDAAWSPQASHLAFSAESNTRHRYIPEASDEEVDELIFAGTLLDQLLGYEIPGQLYWYENYKQGHEQPQERLSYPQDAIDDNPVVKLEWSHDGEYIAYARGQQDDEISGGYFTSLWVTAIDDVRDESTATIDANTILLEDINNVPDRFSDFLWSPSGNGVLTMLQLGDEYFLRYLSRDGSFSFSSPELIDIYEAELWTISAVFSADGQYFAYVDGIESNGDTIPAVFIQSVEGGDRLRLETPDVSTDSIIDKNLQWSPHGDAVIYSVRPNGSGQREFYLANVNGVHQNLELFLSVDDIILRVTANCSGSICFSQPNLP